MGITKEDLKDADVVDAVELASSGSTVYRTIAVVSTTSGPKEVAFASLTYLNLGDTPVSVGDIVTLTGTSGGLGNGTFTVASLSSENILTVVEAIGTSTGGSADFKHPSGAKSIGVDPTNLAYSTATNLQEVLEDISVGSYSSSAHRAENQLVHQIAETSYEEYTYTGNRVDSIIIWTDSGKTTKIREELFTYTGTKVTTIVIKQYDAAGTLITGETLTETYVYTGNQLTYIDSVLA